MNLFGFFNDRSKNRPSEANSISRRSLRLEKLEERALLSVTTLEYAAIRDAYPDAELAADMSETNVVEFEQYDGDTLNAALKTAAEDVKNDVFVVRDVEEASDAEGTVEIVLNGEADLTSLETDINVVQSSSIQEQSESERILPAGLAPFDDSDLTSEDTSPNDTFTESCDLSVSRTETISVTDSQLYDSDQTEQASESNLTVQSNSVADENYAVVFVGGYSKTSNRLDYYNTMRSLYSKLTVTCGLSGSNIYVLYADGDTTNTSKNRSIGYDTDEDGDDDYWEFYTSDMSFATDNGSTVLAATKESLTDTFSVLSDRMTANSHLLFFTSDHGSGKAGETSDYNDYLCGWKAKGSGHISGSFVSSVVGKIKQGYVTCVFGQCYSGGILDDILSPSTGSVCISNYDGQAHFYGMASANHYETSHTSIRGGDTASGGFEYSFIKALSRYCITDEFFQTVKDGDKYHDENEYGNNGGTIASYTEHPWGVGESFSIFAIEDNDSFATAYDLGTLTSTKTRTNLSTRANGAQNWYKFTIADVGTSDSYVQLNYTHDAGSADVDLQLYDSSNTRLLTSEGSSGVETISLNGLAAGTYYIKAFNSCNVTQGVDYTLTINPPVPRPNLVFYEPAAWDDSVLVSTNSDATSSQTTFMTSEDVWVRYAYSTTQKITTSFKTQISLDSVVRRTGSKSGLSPGNYGKNGSGTNLGKLSAGTHTIKVTLDSGSVIDEIDETDNVREITITVKEGERDKPSVLVTTEQDVVDDTDGLISLREAIKYAGTNDLGTTITFDSSLKGKTIELNGTELEITKVLTIDASALYDSATGTPGITIDAGQKSRVVYIDTDTKEESVVLNGLALRNGKTAGYGGGAYVYYSALTTINTTISGNTANNGGGVTVFGGGAVLTNSRITDNTAEYGGGAYLGSDGVFTVTNSIISGNTATSSGGGVYVTEDSQFTSTNTTISENSGSYGAGVYIYSGSLTSYNSIIALNSNNKDVVCLNEGTATGSNNLSSYTSWSGSDNYVYDATRPLFENTEEGDYRLAKKSQAINKGNDVYAQNAGMDDTWTDMSGGKRFVGASIDIGAYEYQVVSKPDLTFCRPDRWSDSLFATSTSGSATSETSFLTSDEVFVGFGFSSTETITVSTRESIFLDGVFVANYVFGEMKAEGCYDNDAQFSLGKLTAGTHTITVKLDVANAIDESDETNNEKTITITVSEPTPKPDLAFCKPDGWSDSIFATLASGSTAGRTSFSTTDDIYLGFAFNSTEAITQGTSERIFVDGKLSVSYTFGELAAETSYTNGAQWSLGKLSAGKHTIKVQLDAGNAVDESDETNNEKTITITVKAPSEQPSVVVTTERDVIDGADGLISIREAISYAGTNGLGTTITFDASLKGKTIELDGMQIDVGKALTIDASALYDSASGTPGITIDAGQKSRVMYIGTKSSDTEVVLKGLKLQNGKTLYEGGGLYLTQVKLTTSDVVVSDNSATRGGGIFFGSASLTATNTTISNNTTTSSGAGVYLFISSFTAINSTISGNKASGGDGGGIDVGWGTFTTVNSIISGNSALNGGGVTVYTGSFTATNTTITGNTATNRGSGVRVTSSSGKFTSYNSLVVLNDQGKDVYSAGVTQGTNNLSTFTNWDGEGNYEYDATKPLFKNAEEGDYRLASDSQAIDKGSDERAKDAGLDENSADLAGKSRFVGASIDIGAYEFKEEFDAPSDLTLDVYNASMRTVTLNWKDNSDVETGFLVEYSIDGGKTWRLSQIMSANETSRVVRGVRANATYDFRICAVQGGKTSEWAYSKTLDTTVKAPQSPSDLTFGVYDATAQTVELTWQDNSENETGFRVEYSTDGGKTWRLSQIMGANSTSRVASDVESDATYNFRVCALQGALKSKWAYSETLDTSEEAPEEFYAPKSDVDDSAFDGASPSADAPILPVAVAEIKQVAVRDVAFEDFAKNDAFSSFDFDDDSVRTNDNTTDETSLFVEFFDDDLLNVA